MKKILIPIVLLILIIITISIFFIVKNNYKKNIKIESIKHMYFSYANSYEMDANVHYEVNYKDGKYIAEIKPYLVADEDKTTVEISEEEIKEIIKLLNDNKVSKWNGFDKSDINVLDGDGFSFNLKTKDDKEIKASGYMMWPENYGKVRGGLESIFKKYIEE